MDKKLEQLRSEYKNIPIPAELDEIVQKALKQPKQPTRTYKWILGAAAAAAIFIASVNTSPTFAKTLSDIPVVGSVVKVITFKEWNVDDKTYNAHIKTPGIKNLENKSLENSLNQKYLEENKKLYKDFKTEVSELKKQGGGHLGVDSGYVVKTDDEQILSIGRYVVNTVGSSSTTFKYDTIDKKNQVLITLPSLFKDDSYIKLISNNIQDQMRHQMKEDPDKIYWVSGTGDKDIMPGDMFKKISANQNFYINKDHKLVISFDKYDVAPGYMGVVEFVIPTDVISKVLVGHEYIR
ncbi:anti-sigma factor [Heyndrickxia shackletonii]|uniref:Anti-sigma factor n=1 Tax=Heyndrickxia shackletonii TaxID=157838 RepID=A0A0Q3TDZ5_9BACI|nr:RsiV family protein [Heyndrickxia shackletonii]KQL52278.1 anti-sigma factor [Heyndrickxia shackletonii]MBB2480742.1 DUF3298 domain-containing protein [Bacillus sp. APMAM]NEZ00299.1 DUF3298 and DUF4163 domain-containing protein [Heyndrickxia shackletonii]RTZ55899.1 DUF3298 domain-containing protein [Bacillus sp. SAJ1]